MNKKSILLVSFIATALVGWIATGSYLFATTCCEEGTTETTTPIPSTNSNAWVQDGNKFDVGNASPILFAINSTTPILAEDTELAIAKTIDYLKDNPLKKLLLIGYYGEEETSNANVGTNRAMAIRSFFMQSNVPDYQVIVETKEKKHLQLQNENLLDMIEFKFEAIAPTAIKDAIYDLNLIFDDNFAFKKSSFNLLMPPSTQTKSNFDKLAAYLRNRSKRKLVITGYYHPAEINSSGLPNLGIVRANKIHMLLTSLGVPEQQIEIKSAADSNLKWMLSPSYGEFMLNSITFEVEAIEPAYLASLAQEKERIEAILLDKKVYRLKDFGEQDMEVIPTEELRTYLADLVAYININPQAAIYCVGHSNRTKDRNEDEKKGFERAKFIKKFLSNHGVHPDKLVVKSVGSTHPLGTDKTPYGQSINRRVDILVSFDGSQPRLSVLPKISTTPDTLKTNKNTKLKGEKDSAAATKPKSTINPSEQVEEEKEEPKEEKKEAAATIKKDSTK